MSERPESWTMAQIGWLCDLINGRAFNPTDWSRDGLPIVRIQNLNNPEAPYNRFAGEVAQKFLIHNDDLLFAWSGTPGTSFGAHIWKGEPAILNQHIFRVEFPEEHIDKRFFRLAINQRLQELIDKAHGGVGLRHVTKGKFEETEIDLPPLNEQRRIVAKLESLDARVTAAHEELDRVPVLIEHYKQAILDAAFRGELTADLRWSRDTAKDDELPEGWTFRQFGDLIDEGPSNGWSPRSGPDATGALTLKLTATTSGEMRLDDKAVKRIYEVPPKHSKYWLKNGDLLIQRANTIEYVGSAAIYEGPDETYIYPDLMMRVRIADPVTCRYVWRYLNASAARQHFRDNATGTAGNMPKINGGTVRSLLVPMPLDDEIAAVVDRIEAAFASIKEVAAEYRNADRLLDHLDQALLSKAFRGELVPQDPNDEPAAVLLERIRGERVGEVQPRRGRRARA